MKAELLKNTISQSLSHSPSLDFSDLKRNSLRGGLVNIVSQGIIVTVQLVSTIILARLLSPEDYGIVAMVTAVTAFAALFRDLGLSAAAIQRKGLTSAQQSNLFWLNVLMGSLITIVIATAAPLISVFYNKPELVKVTLALSLTFLITSFGSQHDASLMRHMMFARSSGARVAGGCATLVVSVMFAIYGFSYWSLVWGTIAGATITTALLYILSPFKPGVPARGTGVRELLGFGAHVTAFNFVNYFSRNLDNILIGRLVGAEALGFYTRAYQLLMFPIVNLRTPIQAVAFPAMSQLDAKSEEFRHYYCRLVGLLAWLTMPLMVWIFESSDEIIYIVLGPPWTKVGPIFSVLAIVGFIQPIGSLRGMILISSGQAKRNLYAGLISAFFVSLGFVIGIQWGALGVAWSYVLSVWLLLIPMQFYCSRGTSIHGFDFVSSAKNPLIVSLALILLCEVVKLKMESASEVIIVSVLGTIVFLVTSVVFLLYPENRKLLIEQFSSFLSKERLHPKELR